MDTEPDLVYRAAIPHIVVGINSLVLDSPLFTLATAVLHRTFPPSLEHQRRYLSGLSMHPVEHIQFFSSVLVHLIVSVHPIHILFHMQHQALTAATSHAGFEALLEKNTNGLALGNFHHQMHHRRFECNYGNLEVSWDKLFRSFHDGTEQLHKRILQRRRDMAGRMTQILFCHQTISYYQTHHRS